MKILRLLTFAVILATSLVGCRKDLPTTIDPRDHIVTNWSEAFEAYWDGMNYNYSFWDVDPTDWDRVYEEYKPKFADLQINNADDDTTAIRLLISLSETLIDHHMAITVQTGTTEFVFSPAMFELKERSYFHLGYDKGLLYGAAYLNQDAGRITNMMYGEQPKGSGSDEKMELLSYMIDGDVAYMTFNHFALRTSFKNKPEGAVTKAYFNFLEIIKNTPGLKGIILDVRQNGGGDIGDMEYVLGPLINEQLFFGYSRTKNGLGRLDYSPWTPWLVNPKAYVGKSITVPIVTLIDLYSGSMSEMMAQAVKALPNGCVIGERSYGATGPIVSPFKITYAGSYDTDIIKVFTSSHRSKDRDGNCYEGIGISPNIEVLLDLEAMNDNRDNQLERAIQYIHTGK